MAAERCGLHGRPRETCALCADLDRVVAEIRAKALNARLRVGRSEIELVETRFGRPVWPALTGGPTVLTIDKARKP